MADDEDRGGLGFGSDTDATAREERGGGNEGNQTSNYGGDGDGDDFTYDPYDPTQGPSFFDKLMDPRRKHFYDSPLFGAAASMLFPGLAPLIKGVGQIKKGANFLGDPKRGVHDLIGNKLNTLDPTGSGFLGDIVSKGTKTTGTDKKAGFGQGSGGASGAMTHSGREGSGGVQKNIQRNPQGSFDPKVWEQLASMMGGQNRQSQPSGRVQQYRSGR